MSPPVAKPDEVGTLGVWLARLLVDLKNRDEREKRTGLVLAEDRRLAFLHDVLGASHSVRRVLLHDLAHDKPVKEHPEGGKMLLHGGGFVRLPEFLHVG